MMMMIVVVVKLVIQGQIRMEEDNCCLHGFVFSISVVAVVVHIVILLETHKRKRTKNDRVYRNHNVLLPFRCYVFVSMCVCVPKYDLYLNRKILHNSILPL
jgi:hypothetical protein